jgi:large subunit ribosomal protein L1
MGKTRTAVISGAPDEKTGKAKYEEKRKKQAEKTAKEEKKKKQVTKVGLKGGERIKLVEAEPIVEAKKEKEEEKKEKKIEKKKRGKNYLEANSKVDKAKLYTLTDAVKLVKDTSFSKFDGTMDLHLTVKKEGLSTQVELPYSFGKKKKIEVANDDTIEKLEKGKVDFDVLLATADMMPKLVPFAKLLGHKGLMPNPKNNTLLKDKKDAKKFSAANLSIKTERKAPLIHCSVGKVSQKQVELKENISAIVNAVGKRQILRAYLTSTMGPSVKLRID